MSKGRKCNKAYLEIEQGITDQPCFFVYNGICWRDDGIPCPMPKMPKNYRKKGKTTMRNYINNDTRAMNYVDAVRATNPQEYPTWEMLETAFVTGMNEQRLIDEGQGGLYGRSSSADDN